MRSASAGLLIASPDADLKARLRQILGGHHVAIIEVGHYADILPTVARHQPRLALLAAQWNCPGDGLSLVPTLHARARALPVILLVRQSSEALAVAALKAGVADYFVPPWPVEEIRASVQRHLVGDAPDCYGKSPSAIIGDSPAIRTLRDYLTKVAQTDISVLLSGETGTGKEIAAHSIHAGSARTKRAFVCINCAAIPDTLFESELFGHEKGAFTGAHARKEGQLEQADGGTVFFDEIGDMSQYVQAKLLRAIELRQICRVGGQHAVPVDIRIVAATNRDLERAVAEGTFRKDLYFRINVARIELPPLRHRKEDIILLADHFRREMNARLRRNVIGFEDDVLRSWLRYDWPGNVRELRNIVETCYIEPGLQRISLADLPQYVRDRLAALQQAPESERDRLLEALVATNWNKSKTAQNLHWSRMTVYRKAAKYHISRGGTPTSGRCQK